MLHTKTVGHSKLIRIVVVLAALFGLASWNPSPAGPFLRGSFHTVFLPIERLFSSLSGSLVATREFLSSIGDMKRENERLVEENVRLTAEAASLAFLRDENESLRKSVGLGIRERYDLTAVEIVARGGGSRNTVLVRGGSMDGIQTGMPAVVGEGVLVGIVDEVYPASSRIALLSGSEIAFGGIVVGNGTQGIVRGDRGLGVLFDKVLRTDPLGDGDRIVTSGIGGTLPPGLLVGSVGSIRDSEDRLFREAGIISPVDFGTLRFLFLIRDGSGV